MSNGSSSLLSESESSTTPTPDMKGSPAAFAAHDAARDTDRDDDADVAIDEGGRVEGVSDASEKGVVERESSVLEEAADSSSDYIEEIWKFEFA